MDTNSESVRTRQDISVNVKIKLSALWAALMFVYTYADIIGFYTPETLEKLMVGTAGNVQITEGFLVVMAIWMAIPSLMIILSLILKARVNRWMNIIAAILSILVFSLTFLAGEITLRYVIQAAVEGVLMAAIVWYAWTWSKHRKSVSILDAYRGGEKSNREREIT